MVDARGKSGIGFQVMIMAILPCEMLLSRLKEKSSHQQCLICFHAVNNGKSDGSACMEAVIRRSEIDSETDLSCCCEGF